MKPKKNPKADLNRKWTLFFQIGLIAVLLLCLQLINWTTSGTEYEKSDVLTSIEITEEEPPVTIFEKPTPPPPPPPPLEIFKEIPNDSEEEETEVAPTEIPLDDFVEPADIEDPEDPNENILVPVEFVELVPIFPGCEKMKDNDDRKACFSDGIRKIIQKEFDTDIASELGLSGTYRIFIYFTIDKKGMINDVKTRAPHAQLEKEAIRVINTLPKMEPGIQAGKPVPVSYTIPLTFKVQ